MGNASSNESISVLQEDSFPSATVDSKEINKPSFGNYLDDLVLQSWVFCKAKPSPEKRYLSDTDEHKRRKTVLWRKRPSFISLDCGEDSFFVSNTYNTIGIADGVNGWRDHGVDSSIFSNMLMKYAKQFTEAHRDESNPEKIIAAAHNKILIENRIQAGSSTACVASLVKKEDGTHFLDVANVGDSGLLVIRNKGVLHRVHEKIHGFNAPFQLAAIPPNRTEASHVYSDFPSDAIREKIVVQEGDVIVMGTDGLFDNLFNKQIASIGGSIGKVDDPWLSRVPVVGFLLSAAFFHSDKKVNYTDPHSVVQEIVNNAFDTSRNSFITTPWSRLLQKCGLPKASGGKIDDITVILSRVTTREELLSTSAW